MEYATIIAVVLLVAGVLISVIRMAIKDSNKYSPDFSKINIERDSHKHKLLEQGHRRSSTQRQRNDDSLLYAAAVASSSSSSGSSSSGYSSSCSSSSSSDSGGCGGGE